jgi:hypothetical protein
LSAERFDRKAGLNSRGDQAPVLDSDRIIAEDGLVGEGDCVIEFRGTVRNWMIIGGKRWRR